MKTLTRIAAYLTLSTLCLRAAPAETAADAIVSRGLASDPAVAASAARLLAAEAALGASAPWRASSATVQVGAKGTDASASSYSWSAQATVPLASWFSLGASGSGDLSGASSVAASATLAPFARRSTAAAAGLASARTDWTAAVRSRTLELRSDLRSLAVLDAEAALRDAELEVAGSRLALQEVLAERGEAKRSDLLSALSAQTEARLAADKARSALQDALVDLVADTGAAETELRAAAAILLEDGGEADAMDEASWLASSAALARARLEAETSASDAADALPRPDLSFKAEAGASFPSASGAGPSAGSSPGSTWSVGATLRLPLDLAYRDAAEAKAKLAQAKAAAASFSENAARLEYAARLRDVERAASSLHRTETAAQAVALGIEESRLLLSLGQRSELEAAQAAVEGLKSDWQLASARKAVQDARDALDPRFAARL